MKNEIKIPEGFKRCKKHNRIYPSENGCYWCRTFKERKTEGKCCAVIFHGPGHQSHTFCQAKGKHKVHFANYGRFEQKAEWKGKKVFSGYFDEPPQE